jgi:hypothetical protein
VNGANPGMGRLWRGLLHGAPGIGSPFSRNCNNSMLTDRLRDSARRAPEMKKAKEGTGSPLFRSCWGRGAVMQPIYYVPPIQTAALDHDGCDFFLRGREVVPCDYSFLEGWAADQTPGIAERRGERLILAYFLMVAHVDLPRAPPRRVTVNGAGRIKDA